MLQVLLGGRALLAKELNGTDIETDDRVKRRLELPRDGRHHHALEVVYLIEEDGLLLLREVVDDQDVLVLPEDEATLESEVEFSSPDLFAGLSPGTLLAFYIDYPVRTSRFLALPHPFQ